ncbi:MAG: FAD-binding protein [bacterium]|nr:FAD-binding protein [bacterium]
MRIVVCVKRTAAGELNPFDACAYEAALRIPDGEVILLSMGPEATEEMLLSLTRLGAEKAYLLCGPEFAGADTLATAYALSQALKRLSPELVFCGRQTVDGDTAQTGPALAALAGLSLITNVMEIKSVGEEIVCDTRSMGEQRAASPALITVERINRLRLPGLRSREGQVILWRAEDIDADPGRLGEKGSPTKVFSSVKNEEGKRKCRFLPAEEFQEAVRQGLLKEQLLEKPRKRSAKRLRGVWIVGETPRSFAESISDDIRLFPGPAPEEDCGRAFLERFVEAVRRERPEAVLWGSDPWSKRTAPQAAALLRTGLCADCTALETDGGQLFMYRPACSGEVIAGIRCTARPTMATVRTAETGGAQAVLSLGRGAKGAARELKAAVDARNRYPGGPRWELAASRAAVDAEILPYERQVGMTGKSVSPAVYIAVGISGAVHHIAGMRRSGTVIAVNPDAKAPIFDYADIGIVCTAEELLRYL